MSANSGAQLICSHWNADRLLKSTSITLNKYGLDKNFQHFDIFFGMFRR